MARSPWEITHEMFLSVDEVHRLRTHVRTRASRSPPGGSPAAHLDELIIELLLFSGLRCSEFCQLRLADAHVGGGGARLAVRGRTVFLPPHVEALLRQYLREVRPRLLPADAEPRDGNQALILSERGGPYERTGLYRRVVRILTDAGLGERASVHLLRHTYAYLAYLRTGGNLLFVQRQLGHAHPMITSLYAQFVDEDYAKLAAAVGVGGAPRRARRPLSGLSRRTSQRRGAGT